MVQKQRRRAAKLEVPQRVHPEGTSPVMPEAISPHKDDQAVEEKQSYVMITGLLQILVASIAYQRDLFPKSCFEMRSPSLILTEARSNITGNDSEMARFANALAERDQPFLVLVSGKTSGVDKLLAWLDEIFKGLLDHSLNRVQFSIYADESRPSEILELYTFSFQYHDGMDGERQLLGLTAPGHGSGLITTRSIRASMVNVIDQFNQYQQQLPALPKKRYLMCRLLHSRETPRQPRPLGFHTCTDVNMAVIENWLWHMKQRSFGSIDTGIYRMLLEIGFAAHTDAAKDFDHRSVLGQNMEYTRTLSRILTPDLEGRFKDQPAAPVGTQMIKRPRESFKQTNKQGDSIRSGISQDSTTDLDRSTVATRSIMSPESPTRHPGESVRTHATLSGDSLLPTQVIEVHDPPALLTWNWKLRAGKEMEMSVKGDKIYWTAARDNGVVRCECSSDREEEPMLRCICCQELQHYYCYGFARETHVHEHYCYQCLLEDTHEALLGDMKSIAIFRRALWVLYEKTPPSPARFAQELHLDGETTQGLIKQLDEGGYLAAGRTRLAPVTTPEQLMFKSQLYHNPLTSISGFYELREDTPPANTGTEDGKLRRKRTKI